MIETGRIGSETYNELPDVIERRPLHFSSSIANADRIDGSVAGYMDPSLLYIAAAETDIRVMREKTPDQCETSPLATAMALESNKRLRDKAAYNLNIARFKLDEARLNAITEGEQRTAVPKETQQPNPRSTVNQAPPANFGLLYAVEGRYEPAVEQTQKGLRLNPDNVMGYDNLAQCLLALNRFDDTRKSYDEAWGENWMTTLFI